MDIGAHERNGRAADSDSDDMPDYWENLYGFDPGDAMDAGEDADGDGDSNLVEFQNGTNPQSRVAAPSAPEILSISQSETGVISFSFTSEEGVEYLVESSDDLDSWISVVPQSGTGNPIEFNILPMSDIRRYYRVRVAEEGE